MNELEKNSYDVVEEDERGVPLLDWRLPLDYQQFQTGPTGTTATQFLLPLKTFQTDQISKAGQGLVARQPVLTTATALGSVGYFQTNNLVVSGFSNWFWNNNN